ncbi:MAG: putative rane protein [Pseudarthrobacter sp.]|nr:putative rane protein [Pseudarthrobacter sp.]
MAGDERQEADPRFEEPVYEVIGAGRLNPEAAGDDDDLPRGPGAARVLLGHALGEIALSVRSGRFWWQAATVLLASLGTALLALVAANGGAVPPDAARGACILTAAILVVVSCGLALIWARHPGITEAGRERPAAGPFLHWAVACGRGAVFAVLAALFLVALAYATKSSPAIAGVAAALVFLEFLVFAAVGAETLWWFSKTTGRVVAWSAAFLLLVGNLLAVAALLPTVRTTERVLVAVNIERDESGRLVSWQCLPELRGFTKVDHIERIAWIAASNPLVLFGLLAAGSGSEDDALVWLPGEMQNAADGSQVPCVEGQERDRTAAELPLAAVGIALQLSMGVLFLAGASRAGNKYASGDP